MTSFTLRALFFIAFLPVLAACSLPPDHMDMSGPGVGMARLGDKMFQKGDMGTAIDFYRRSLSSDPANFQAIKGLALALEQWGDRTGALEVYQEGIAERPRDNELRRLYAKQLLKLDQAMLAKDQYEIALNIDGDDEKARTSYGVSLDYLGEHKEAQKQYERVLKQNPDNFSALNNLAYSKILTRRPNEAVRLLEPVLKRPEATKALRQNLALAYGLSGMDEDARRVARMDLSAEKVEENMDYYRRRRGELSIDRAPYAEMGSYATKGMALAQIKKLQGRVGSARGHYKPVIIPEVSAPGGTPRFAVRMMGCSRPSDISRLCKIMRKSGLPCAAKGNGM